MTVKKTYQIYYSFFLRYKARCLLFVSFLLVWTIANNVQPYFFKLFVDGINLLNSHHLFILLYYFIGVRLLARLFMVLTFWVADWIIIDTARDARLAVVKKIQDLDFAYHLKNSTGSLISAMKRGDNAFYGLNHDLNIQIAQTFISLFVVLYFFKQVDLSIVILMLISVLINLVFAFFLIKKNIQSRKSFNDAEDQASAIIVDGLINFDTVKLFAREKYEYHRLKDFLKFWRKKIWEYSYTYRWLDSVLGIGTNLGFFVIISLSLQWLTEARLTAGDYVMILTFLIDFYQRFFDLVYHFRNVAKNHADIQKYFQVFDEEVEVKDPIKAKEISDLKGQINFKQVSFSYPEGKENAVKDINLKIHENESVALVGRSGSGKTTLVKLLMRFYDPDKGRIEIDDLDIKDLDKAYLRSLIAVVPQDPILFNLSIGYNIAYGAHQQVQEIEIISAAKLANIHDFIKTLPDGYNTLVGERGIKLSGGQKQRLAIARMILANPKIFIFDEATSQLDSESEKKIQAALWKVARNKTTIIIAHRLSSVMKADRIIVLEEGKIIEVGTHQQLTNRAGIYQKLWQLQTKGYLRE